MEHKYKVAASRMAPFGLPKDVPHSHRQICPNQAHQHFAAPDGRTSPAAITKSDTAGLQENGLRRRLTNRPSSDIRDRVGIDDAQFQQASPASTSVKLAVRLSISAENLVPKEINHGEVGVGMHVVNEMQLLFAPEPGEAFEPGSCDVVFLV
jgi:hypothetical protein